VSEQNAKTSNDSGRDATPCYVARCLCGCKRLVFASVDDGKHPKQTAKDIAGLIRKGYTIERMSVSEVRVAKWMCAKDVQPSVRL